MSSTAVSFKIVPRLVPVAILVAAGFLLRSLEPRAQIPTRLRTEQLSIVSGHGGVLAWLGGLRSALASACWLRANLAWERRDVAETRALIELTVALDERPLYFWLNGARILACDLPAWRLDGVVAPESWRAQVNEEQAQQALRLLAKGLRWHGPDAALYIEIANIHLRRRNDLDAAARYYRLAAEQPGAPRYAARIHAELLRELGRRDEALTWLRQILPGLDSGDPLARRDIVLDRIATLEQELAVR